MMLTQSRSLPCSVLGRQVSQMNENIARSFLCYLNDFRTWNVIEHLVRESFLQDLLLSGLPGQCMRLNSHKAHDWTLQIQKSRTNGSTARQSRQSSSASDARNATIINDGIANWKSLMLKHYQMRVQVDASTLNCAKTNMSMKKWVKREGLR